MSDRDFHEQPLTVAELIELLKQCPQDASVDADGCDCTAGATGLIYTRPNKHVPNGNVLVARDVYDAVTVRGL